MKAIRLTRLFLRCCSIMEKGCGVFSMALLLCASACLTTAGPNFVGMISCSAQGKNVSATVSSPCEVDLDFGLVPIGQELSATIQINNPGNSTVNLLPSSIDVDPVFGVGSGGLAQSIPPGGSASLTVTFQPVKAGSVTSTFSIPTSLPSQASGAQSPSVDVKLTGQGFQANLAVSPTSVDFGTILINTTATRTVTLTNNSTEPLTGIAAAVGGTDAALFALDGVPMTLAAGASVQVSIAYAPLTLETRSLASVIFSCEGGTATVDLAGEPVGVALTLAPNPCDFGYVPLQTTAICCTTVTNQANVTVSINGVSSFGTGPFGVSKTDGATPPNPAPIPVTIAGGGSAKICFSFTPPATQQYTGQATLDTDDPSGTNPTVQLTGWGGGPQISCYPGSLAFGQVPDHFGLTLPVICTNTGTAIPTTNLLIQPPTASPGVFTAEFDATKDPYPLAGLAPGESSQIDVTYTPTTTSSDNGTLVIQNNGGQGQEVRITLTGQGLNILPCQFVIAPSSVNFGNVQLGDKSLAISLEIDNVGTDICELRDLAIQADASSSFHILSTSIAPDPLTGRITIPEPAPGATSSLSINLDFAPTEAGALSAEAAFTITDPADPNQVVALIGSSESTCLVVAPSSLSFGDVAENDAGRLCTSASRTFSIFNGCQDAAQIASFAIQSGPGDLLPQFSVPSGAPLPFTIQPGASGELYEMFFEPTTLGTHTAQMLISDGTVDTLLPLSGSAVSTSTETDSFVAGSAKADILFVLDVGNGGAVENAIVNDIGDFIEGAGSRIDYRIAIATDDDDPKSNVASFGQLLPCPTCSPMGPGPQIISRSSVPDGGSAPDPATALGDLIGSVSGSNGIPGERHFFSALYEALQRGPQPNVDFFRPGAFFAAITENATLDDDNSPGNWYSNYFAVLFQQQFLFTWNFISQSADSTGTGLLAGTDLPPRIQQILQATNGVALNVSDGQWTSALGAVWSSALSAGAYYSLLGTPSEGQNGIVVTSNGHKIAQLAGPGDPNWTYQAAVNAVIFAPSVAQGNGAQITITYPIGCD